MQEARPGLLLHSELNDINCKILGKVVGVDRHPGSLLAIPHVTVRTA